MDFTLRKDKTTQPPHYIVIFKAKDADNLEQAFREFTAKTLQRAAALYPQGAGSSQAESRPAAETRQRKNQAKGVRAMKPELKKLLVLNLPYLLFVYLFAKCGQAYRLAAGADASAKLLHLTGGISAAFANPLPSLHLFDLCVGVVGAVAVRLIVYSKGKNAKKYRKGEEYGSARWGTAGYCPYIDPKFENNILLTQTERLTMTGRPKAPKTARNKNVLVIGGRQRQDPLLCEAQPHAMFPPVRLSHLIRGHRPKRHAGSRNRPNVPAGGLPGENPEHDKLFQVHEVQPLCLHPLGKRCAEAGEYPYRQHQGRGRKVSRRFWVKSERLFYTALIGYIWYEAPAE